MECNPLNYVETYCIILSIPIIYILYVSSVIKKEFAKREKNAHYCGSDIMEMETVRHYVNTTEYKNLVTNIWAASIIFSCFSIILVGLILFIAPEELNMTALEAFIIACILCVFGIIQMVNNYKFSKSDISEYDKKIAAVEKNLPKSETFYNFPEAFRKPFIERWRSLQDTQELLTLSEIIDKIDNEKINIVPFLRPADNYFFEDTKVKLKKDIDYLYNIKLVGTPLTLPALSDYTVFAKCNEVIAWIILIFLYYNIFHIYFNDVDMFLEITIALIITLALCMIIYYITIAKDEL